MNIPDTAARLPRELLAGGSSVAVIARPIAPGVLAHRYSQEIRAVAPEYGKPANEAYYVTACAADDLENADDAYLVTVAWADHLGATACTEPACFPEAVAAR
jgi:hypothetical protein